MVKHDAYNKREGESTLPYYLSRKEITGDYAFSEDLNLIDYSKYKERLRTSLTGMLEVRNYSKADINQMLELVESKKEKKRREII